jgi:hypothetical protein
VDLHPFNAMKAEIRKMKRNLFDDKFINKSVKSFGDKKIAM